MTNGFTIHAKLPSLNEVISKDRTNKSAGTAYKKDSRKLVLMDNNILACEYGVKPYRVFIYLLVTSDIDNAVRRVESLKRFRRITIYAQAERNERLGIVPDRLRQQPVVFF